MEGHASVNKEMAEGVARVRLHRLGPFLRTAEPRWSGGPRAYYITAGHPTAKGSCSVGRR